MTLQEAIKNLTFLLREGTQDMESEDYEAVKLGIEALKLVKELRGYLSGAAATLLPGETEDKGVT